MEEKESPKKNATKKIDVIVIRTIKGKSALVHWNKSGIPRRAIVPLQEEYTEDVLEAGVPYGIQWDKVIKLNADSESLAKNLYKRGIWTSEDARTKTQLVINALTETYAVDLTAILAVATKEKNNAS